MKKALILALLLAPFMSKSQEWNGSNIKTTNPSGYPYGVNINTTITGGWAREFSFSRNGSGKFFSFGAHGTGNSFEKGYIGGNYSGDTVHGTPWMTFLSNGNIGIGTISPVSKLTINGNVQISNASIPMGLMTELGGTTPLLNMGINFRSPDKNEIYAGAGFRIDSRSNYPLFQWLYRQENSSTELILLSLTKEGSLGIGTSSPSEKLHISGKLRVVDTQIWDNEINRYNNDNLYIGYRNTANTVLQLNGGGVGIATATIPEGYKLAVDGKAIMEEIQVASSGSWPDYVFNNSYDLKPLSEVSTFISENGHLPNIPTAKEVKENGIKLGEMNAKLLEKVEELTLYLIEQNKKIEKQQKEIEILKSKVK